MQEGMESAYNRKEKHEKKMCKHCKSSAHSSLEHRKHYKNFKDEKRQELQKKHMKMFEPNDASGETKEHGAKSAGASHKHMKAIPKTFGGKSTKLGHGGRAKMLESKLTSKGMPKSEVGAIVGNAARAAHAAPGQANFHGKHKKAVPSESDMGSMKGYDPTGGLGNKGYAKATAVPKAAVPVKLPPSALRGMSVSTPSNVNSTIMHAKHKKGIGGGFEGKNLKSKKA